MEDNQKKRLKVVHVYGDKMHYADGFQITEDKYLEIISNHFTIAVYAIGFWYSVEQVED